MSSLTEPRTILSSLTSKFQAADDGKSIENINLHYERIISDRVNNLSTSREILHQWIKKVEVAKWESQRPADRSETAHHERMALLDRERLSTGKSVNDLESAIHQGEASVLYIKSCQNQVASDLDSLKSLCTTVSPKEVCNIVYRELGISWFAETGQPLRCVIQNRKSNDIIPVTLNENHNTYELANSLWGLFGK